MDYPAATVPVAVAEVLSGVVEYLQSLFASVESLPDARGLEKTVHEGLKEIDRRMMEVCVVRKASQAQARDVREVRCRRCPQGEENEGWAVLSEPATARYALTVRGRVDFTRPVYVCMSRDCRRERAPFDEELGLEGKNHLTPLLENKAVWAGTMLSSYEKAEEEMAHQVEIAVSAKEIHCATARVGERALALQNQEVSDRGRPASLDKPLEVEERPETVVVEMDGTCVMGRDGEGHDVKCGTVFGLDARARTGSPGKERPLLLRRCYCATSRGIRPFGAMLWATASWWGARTAKRIVVIGDGAEWIWKYSSERFRFALADGGVQEPVEILDFYHAAENLGLAQRAIYADPESARAKEWFKTWKDRLREGGVDSVIEELDQRARKARGKNQRKELELRAAYFREHRARMRYPEFEAQGLPIGSGAIEGTCKNLIKGRMDCVGQHWNAEVGIERMTALRVRLFNKRWDDLWNRELAAA